MEFLLESFRCVWRNLSCFGGGWAGVVYGITSWPDGSEGWAEVYGKPIAAVSALEAVAVQAHSRCRVVVPVLDATAGSGLFRALPARAGEALGKSVSA